MRIVAKDSHSSCPSKEEHGFYLSVVLMNFHVILVSMIREETPKITLLRRFSIFSEQNIYPYRYQPINLETNTNILHVFQACSEVAATDTIVYHDLAKHQYLSVKLKLLSCVWFYIWFGFMLRDYVLSAFVLICFFVFSL